MDKLELYNKATEAYYSGHEIMPDYEYDALEEELGLKNKNLGSSHSDVYTIKHPVIMGSLAKVQVHNDNFDEYYHNVLMYITRYYPSNEVIITPKFDGCSFEVHYLKGKILNASTRGDGRYGKDITPLIKYLFTKKHIEIPEWENEFCIRGELLLKKHTFEKKYQSEFKNPRSFISGLVNSDWDESLKPRVEDITPIVYDFKILRKGKWVDKDWMSYSDPDMLFPDFYVHRRLCSADQLWTVYNNFLTYRETTDYPLDGIVIKPVEKYRITDIFHEYPKDCVAVKFKPMLQETTIIDIEWNLGKTGEWIPSIITEPVVMDGKTISRASASNYGNIIKRGLYIGTKVILSLAGDIIPYIYKVTEVSKTKDMGDIPGEQNIVGCHLMAELSPEMFAERKFINSALTLNIPGIGEATASTIWANIKWKNKDKPYNILCLKPHTIFKALGRGKLAENAKNSFIDIKSRLTLSEVIQSCNFPSCGKKVSDQIANMLMGLPHDFMHLPEKAYRWSSDINSLEILELIKVLRYMKLTIDDFEKETSFGFISERIPIIMTGKPNNYDSKSDFLIKNPQYIETGSWSEAKIVFTNSLDGLTAKMKKAKERGLEIQLY